MELFATAVALIYTVVSHELAHGYVAYLNGDPTAKEQGRLSPNPIKHLDPLGAIALVIFGFGWAKPVPINPQRFTHRRAGLIAVSLAGVTVNLISAFLSLYLLKILPVTWTFFAKILHMIALYGVAFCVFNLVPVPPLDGYRVLSALLPNSLRVEIEQRERFFYFVLMLLVFSGMLRMVISPIISRIFNGMVMIIYG